MDISGKGVAILNSLTNWLTYGDITVAHDDGSVEVLEVKRSKTTSSRVVRQKQKMRELVTFLEKGRGSLEGKTVLQRLSNSVYVECVDFRVISKDEGRLSEQRELLTRDWARGDDIHAGESLECLSFSPNLAPFSIFPFQPAICVDLLTGAKSYRVLLNVTAVAREFEYRGWEIKTTPKQVFEAGRFGEDFMTVGKSGFRITLPPASFMRLHMELLRPQVLINQCELVRRAGPGAFGSEFNLPVYEHEGDIWS